MKMPGVLVGYVPALLVGVPSWGLVVFACMLLYFGIFSPTESQIINTAVPVGLIILVVGGLGVLTSARLVHGAAVAQDRPSREDVT